MGSGSSSSSSSLSSSSSSSSSSSHKVCPVCRWKSNKVKKLHAGKKNPYWHKPYWPSRQRRPAGAGGAKPRA